MRITLSENEFEELLNTISFLNKKSDEERSKIVAMLLHKKNEFEKSNSTAAKYSATKNATETRKKNAKNKIENAIKILRYEDKKVTQSSIAKVSGCSINTVKKYQDVITI